VVCYWGWRRHTSAEVDGANDSAQIEVVRLHLQHPHTSVQHPHTLLQHAHALVLSAISTSEHRCDKTCRYSRYSRSFTSSYLMLYLMLYLLLAHAVLDALLEWWLVALEVKQGVDL
jgi:hypothetical protein